MIFNKNDNGTQEIALIATWTANHDYLHIEKALLLAKRKVLKITGKEIYNVALEHYKSENYNIVDAEEEFLKLDKLVFWFQTVFLNFAYSKNMYKDTVLWNNSGINVTWSDDMRPATQEALTKLSESFDRDGYEFLDLLIEFIVDNDFAEFKDSLESRKLKELMINSAEEFNYYFNIKNSVSYFFEIIDVIRRIQRTEIANAVGDLLYYNLQIYQQNRLDIEASNLVVDTVEELPSGADEKTIAFVSNNRSFYIKKTDWEYLCSDVRKLLNMIKPALVDFSMYAKFLSDFSNLKAEPKQIEILRANISYLKENANNEIAKIVLYLKELNELETDNEAIEIVSPVYEYNSKNTFLM